jgi:hypothetical protein
MKYVAFLVFQIKGHADRGIKEKRLGLGGWGKADGLWILESLFRHVEQLLIVTIKGSGRVQLMELLGDLNQQVRLQDLIDMATRSKVHRQALGDREKREMEIKIKTETRDLHDA